MKPPAPVRGGQGKSARSVVESATLAPYVLALAGLLVAALVAAIF